jgi:hypothetical protein
LGLVVAVTGQAGEVISRLEIDGQLYESVRWGPVNQGKIVVLHSRGSTLIPVEKLPEQHRQQLGIQLPAPSAVPPAPAREARGDSAYERAQRQQRERAAAATREQQRAAAAEQARWAVLDGALVAKAELTQLTGFVRSRAETHDGEQVLVRGLVIELAERRDPTREIPAHLEMRPGLWQPSGERVLVVGCRDHPRIGELIRVWGREEPDRVQAMRVFTAAREPTAAEVAGR